MQDIDESGVQPEINQPALKSILVPKLSSGSQQTIRESIDKSRRTRENACSLLDATKRAVEIAIEQNEEAALAYLKEQETVHI